MMRMRPMWAVRFAANKYPLLGPLVYALSLQFFVVQSVVAALWTEPAYSYSFNTISDLGNTVCGPYGERLVCSPGYNLFNISIIALGFTMAAGSLLIYQQFTRTRLSFAAFWLMALAGIGSMLVGIYPENTIGWLHALGAVLALGVGNVALILFAFAIKQAKFAFRVYTLLTGVVSLAAFGLFITGNYFGLGQGGMERVAGHPQTLWLIVFGLYMGGVRMRARRLSKH